MGSSILLTEIRKGKVYEITGFVDDPSVYSEKLHKMGFVAGTAIELAPVRLSDPVVYQIRGSRIALRKTEARQILVREF